MSDCKEIMREVTDKFCDRLDEIFKYDREWMVKELKTLKGELTKKPRGARKDEGS